MLVTCYRIALRISLAAALTGSVVACEDEKDSKESEDEAPEGAEAPVASDQPTSDEGGGTTPPPSSNDEDPAACGSLANGATTERTRYQAATATKGLATCVSEEQTVSCIDGALVVDGTFEHETCTERLAALEQGDILIMREEGGGGVGGNGEILAISPTTGFKGLAFDSAGIVPWYGYGLRLSRDFWDEVYSVEMGSSNADLAISVRRFPIITSYPHTLGAWTEGPASDAVYFQGAASEEHRTLRYVAKNDGQELHVYSQYSGELTNCTISMPSGKHARAIFSGTQRSYDITFVAYTLGTGTSVTGYGVAKLTGANCSDGTGSPMTVTTQFENAALADAKVTSVTQIRSGDISAGSWNHNDIFVTVGPFLAGQSVVHWRYDGSAWSEQSSPFEDTARAIYQDYDGDIYTMERDGSATFIRRYGYAEVGGTHFLQTVYTDPDESVLMDTNLGHWLVVLPELPN